MSSDRGEVCGQTSHRWTAVLVQRVIWALASAWIKNADIIWINVCHWLLKQNRINMCAADVLDRVSDDLLRDSRETPSLLAVECVTAPTEGTPSQAVSQSLSQCVFWLWMWNVAHQYTGYPTTLYAKSCHTHTHTRGTKHTRAHATANNSCQIAAKSCELLL